MQNVASGATAASKDNIAFSTRSQRFKLHCSEHHSSVPDSFAVFVNVFKASHHPLHIAQQRRLNS